MLIRRKQHETPGLNMHNKLNDLIHLYLIVGGMPEAVQKYINTNNLQIVRDRKNRGGTTVGQGTRHRTGTLRYE